MDRETSADASNSPDAATEPKAPLPSMDDAGAAVVPADSETGTASETPLQNTVPSVNSTITTKQQQQAPSTSSNVAVSKPLESTTKEASSNKPVPSLEEANSEMAKLLETGKVAMEEVMALQTMMRQHVALQEKVTKLKSLLGRSAKAQRETKLELDGTQKKLEQALQRVEHLTAKVEHLASRPTHMDLLADFETNFDKALLSVGTPSKAPNQQSGGQDSSSANTPITEPHVSAETSSSTLDGMLMQELNESKNRVERLESLNSALLHRSSQLEQSAKEFQTERDGLVQKLNSLQLELKMAQMEASHATRALQDKESSLQEMQMEIDLVTKASVSAQVRAQKGEEAAQSQKTERQHVEHLEAQVVALQEWAEASAEAKRLANERVAILERQVKIFQSSNSQQQQEHSLMTNSGPERTLMRLVNSLVIGAGDVGFKVVELETASVSTYERVVLRWKFDLTPSDMGIEYNILRGRCDSADKQRHATYLIKDRQVMGGAAGETEGAFEVENSCTLLWSNKSSWVRPRTVKYEVDVIAVLGGGEL